MRIDVAKVTSKQNAGLPGVAPKDAAALIAKAIEKAKEDIRGFPDVTVRYKSLPVNVEVSPGASSAEIVSATASAIVRTLAAQVGIEPAPAGAPAPGRDGGGKKIPKEVAITGEKLPPLGSAEQTAFQRKVYDAQLRDTVFRRNLSFSLGVSEGELAVVEGQYRMKSGAAASCRALLAKARSDLALAKKNKTDKSAKKVSSIGVVSAYRDAYYDLEKWCVAYRTHFARTAAARAALPGGAFGEKAVALLVKSLIPAKAVAGFSNHSRGISVDFTTTEAGLGTLGPSTKQKEAWKKAWFYKWLVKNAAAFKFKPLATEEWHWDFADASGGAAACEGAACAP